MKKPVIFSDFDGTFAKKDVGHHLFKHFSDGGNLPLVDNWKKGLITTRECLISEASLVRAEPDDVYMFLDRFDLRPGAIEFYKITKKQNIPFYIVSDGTDIYIKYILSKYGVGEIKYFSNKGLFKDGGLELEFLYDNRDCVRCGNCKGARINDIVGQNRGNRMVVYIGDGLSDVCAVPYADIIFARGDLLQYCNENGYSSVEYADFFDILRYLKGSGLIAG